MGNFFFVGERCTTLSVENRKMFQTEDATQRRLRPYAVNVRAFFVLIRNFFFVG